MTCTLCPLGEKALNSWIPARQGDCFEPLHYAENKKFLLVGEAPGPTEEKQGLAFVGRAGQLLQKALFLLGQEGLNLSEVGVTNLVRCFPGRNPKGKIKPPNKKSKDTCVPYLYQEILRVNPELIVCLGGQTFNYLFPEVPGGVTKNRIKIYGLEVPTTTPGVYGCGGEVRAGDSSVGERESPEGEGGYEESSSDSKRRVFPTSVTYHPSACLRNPNLRPDFLRDLEYLLCSQAWKEEGKKIPVTLVNTLSGMKKAFELLDAAEVIGLDIETRGLTPHILTIGASFGNNR